MDYIPRGVYDDDDDGENDRQQFDVVKVPLGLALMYYFVPLSVLYEHRQMEQALGRALYLKTADFRQFTLIGALKACDQMSRFIWTSYMEETEIIPYDSKDHICDQYLNIIDPCSLHSTLQNSTCV